MSTKYKFTDGDWHVDGWNITAVIIGRPDDRYISKIGYVCVFNDEGNGRNGDEIKFEERCANARLIASAPKMFKMLEQVVSDVSAKPDVIIKAAKVLAYIQGGDYETKSKTK